MPLAWHEILNSSGSRVQIAESPAESETVVVGVAVVVGAAVAGVAVVVDTTVAANAAVVVGA